VLFVAFGLVVVGNAHGANGASGGDVNGVAFVVFLVPGLVCFCLGLRRCTRHNKDTHETLDGPRGG